MPQTNCSKKTVAAVIDCVRLTGSKKTVAPIIDCVRRLTGVQQ